MKYIIHNKNTIYNKSTPGLFQYAMWITIIKGVNLSMEAMLVLFSTESCIVGLIPFFYDSINGFKIKLVKLIIF